ncbi:MAG: methyltransferase domain-containing protein [Rhizobiales bacterium]|nr:methyltransferase domain-containing protein [Hyphomicrobiales bacterium]
MREPIASALQLADQAVKVAAFAALQEVVRRADRRRPAGKASEYRTPHPVPERREITAALRALLESDARAVGEGLWPATLGPGQSVARIANGIMGLLADVPRAADRRRSGEARGARELPGADNLPDYFVQDFHFQDGGYLTGNSARLYDLQVETLFSGTAAAMRRQAIRPIVEHVRGRDQRTLHLLDVACGTGRFLGDVLGALPAIAATGIDLSAPYIEEAGRHLGRRRNLTLRVANAEDIPEGEASHDVLTCVYLFHELPRGVRRTVIGEMARVLKPGGLLVLVDSLQWDDVPGWNGLLDTFPERFHEPYYRDYLGDDLDGAMTAAGLVGVATWPAFLSKVMVRRRA